MLQAIRRYWYLFTLLFIMLGSFLSGWSWFILSHLYNITAVSEPSLNTSGHMQRPPLPTPTFSTLTYAVHPEARLLIPRIGVDAPLEAVGIATDGSMAVPVQRNGVGWYKYGPYPGETGSAVLAGHLNHPNGSPAVFWKLRLLHHKDIVIIKESTGKILRFSVLYLKVYTIANAPKQIIFGRRGGIFLNLITCAGTWQPGLHQTSQHLVVYTKLLS